MWNIFGSYETAYMDDSDISEFYKANDKGIPFINIMLVSLYIYLLLLYY